ncbi:VIT and vWA domain-containing protein [Thalassotalea crassostreae]|uniref:VIT and vWA domain-containing protein n=1 Tax=Thalassotalea crassostreae TaxID=1763536 RepID=UPI000838BDC5|nr:VIT and VWA domain-containing protein [Thalassotalea crassostreae]
MTTLIKDIKDSLKRKLNQKTRKPIILDPLEPNFIETDTLTNTTNNESLLTSVTAHIEFYFPLAVTTICQEFVNNTDDNIEGIYQFPLPKEAGFISFQTALNDEVYQGQVKGKSVAENDYEEAVSNGDTSILVEKIQDGLFQINVGNLAPNDTVKFELTLATLLTLTPSSARYYLPTVIANNYGRSHLDPFNTPKTNFLVEHPFSGTLKVGDALQAQRLESAFNLKALSNQEYQFDGYLDQDFVINIALSPNQPATAIYCQSPDNNQSQHNEYAAMATIPAKQALAVQNANVQLLVDCSGSMRGYSIEQARDGMARLFDMFNANDNINLFRFGSSFEQVLANWQPFTGKAKSTLRRAITNLRADLGGTELIEALKRTLENAKQQKQSDILLLTDGEIWRDQEQLFKLIIQAQESNCRVSVLGLGNSVNESLLSEIAKQTGGYAIFVNPNENIADKVATLLAQMKSAKGKQRFEQVPHTTWKSLPSSFVNQMPSIAYMMGKELPERDLVCLQQANEEQSTQQTIPWQQATGMQAKALTAITVTQRMFEASHSEKQILAETYEQISDYTSFIMVAEREEKQSQMPKLKHVPQMQVEMQRNINIDMADAHCMSMPMESYSMKSPAAQQGSLKRYSKSSSFSSSDSFDIPAFLRRQADPVDEVLEFLTKLNIHLDAINQHTEVPNMLDLEIFGLPENILMAIEDIIKSLNEEQISGAIATILLRLNVLKGSILDEHIVTFLTDNCQGNHIEPAKLNRLIDIA